MRGVVREVRMMSRGTGGITIVKNIGARIMLRTWIGMKIGMMLELWMLRRRGEVGLGRCWTGCEECTYRVYAVRERKGMCRLALDMYERVLGEDLPTYLHTLLLRKYLSYTHTTV
jgi:hypothetical protein